MQSMPKSTFFEHMIISRGVETSSVINARMLFLYVSILDMTSILGVGEKFRPSRNDPNTNSHDACDIAKHTASIRAVPASKAHYEDTAVQCNAQTNMDTAIARVSQLKDRRSRIQSSR